MPDQVQRPTTLAIQKAIYSAITGVPESQVNFPTETALMDSLADLLPAIVAGWETGGGGSGTVTSIGLTAPAAGFTFTGSPVTTSGNITATLADDLAGLEAITGMGVVDRTAANAYATLPSTVFGKSLLNQADAAAVRTTIGTAALGSATPVNLGTAAAGSATAAAKEDHVHNRQTNIVNGEIDASANIAQSKIQNLSTDLSNRLLLSGGSLSGFLTLHADPTTSNHAATKAYVDALVNGLAWKSPALVRVTTNVTIASPGATLDGVGMTVNDRVLLIGQTAPAENGIYLWNGAGVPMTRTTDADTGAELVSASINVTAGTGATKIYVQSTQGPITLGTTAIAFVEIGSALGTVTSVNIIAPVAGITFSGGPVTTSGSITAALTDDLAGLEAITGTGVVERTGTNTYGTTTITATGRSIIASADASAARTVIGAAATAHVHAGEDITSGTVASARLPSTVTLQGNSFNGNTQLVQTLSDGKLPILDGSNLTGVSSTGFTGSLAGDVTGTQGATVVARLNGQSLAALATGLIKNTTTTGVPTIAVAGTDYLSPSGSGAALTALNASNLGSGTVPTARLGSGTANSTTYLRGDQTYVKAPTEIGFAVSDETTIITSGTAKLTFRMPYAMTLTAVRSNLKTVSTSGLVTVDINEGGATILSTKLSIDANEKTSVTAATPAVISDSALADDAEITIDIDAAGTGAVGLKVWMIGTIG